MPKTTFVIGQMTFYRGKIYATLLKQMTSQISTFPLGSFYLQNRLKKDYGKIFFNEIKYFLTILKRNNELLV